MSDWLALSGQTIIVTGGSSGIGSAISDELALNGANVIIADIQISKELKENQSYIQTDVTNRESVAKMVKQVVEGFGSIDGLVNNAGINVPRLLVSNENDYYELDDETFDKMIAINQKGVFICSQLVAKAMSKANKGVIVNIASESGLEGSEGQSVYAATKAALYSYTRSWAKELGKYQIRVVGVAPGILEETGLRTLEYEESLAYTRGMSLEELRASYDKVSIPMRRVGKLQEVADMVSFLVSERASYVTGTTFNITGGKSRA